MSDVMFYGVLRMPYEMAMESELSRRQFYSRVQEAADRVEKADAENTDLRARVAELEAEKAAVPAAAGNALTDKAVIKRLAAQTGLIVGSESYGPLYDFVAAIEQHLRAAGQGKDSEDAKRYRYLRTAGGPILEGKELDAAVDRAIDAAMKAGAQGGGK